jgi:para-aminobenzoate synthetase/4-amino-4-deoxychorismate lyase
VTREIFRHAPDVRAGVFTSIDVRGGKPMFLEHHLERLRRSCRELYGVPLPAEVERCALERASVASDSERLRIDVIPAGDDVKVELSVGSRPDGGTAAVALDVVVADWHGGQKWRDRSMLPDVHSLFVDEHDIVLEADFANVFAVIDGHTRTPVADGRILPGVARSYILEVERRIVEEELSLSDLLRADEVFVTNAVRGVVPVMRCGLRTWLAPGPVTADLMRRWRRLGP